MKLTKICLFILATALFPLSGSVCCAQVVAIKAGKLVDQETSATAINQTIIVENGRIQAVGRGLPIPADAKLIDLSNATVLPGLFDAETGLL